MVIIPFPIFRMIMEDIFFDNKYRAQIIDRIAHEEFDIAIIGGGITGAGIALDAATRGLKTVLIEKLDFASGTSSKSTKLIHGGLRYLKNLEFALVHETGTERALLHQLAPQLVIPEKMLLPLTKDGSFGKWSTSAGLRLYDLLAGVKGDDKRKMLNKEMALKIEPLLKQDNLIGAGYYAEYRTDDARLTIENIKTAIHSDAICINYIEAYSPVEENGQLVAYKCIDNYRNKELTIRAKLFINASGPWADIFRKKNNTDSNQKLALSKGIHIVIPRVKLPLGQAVYFDVDDGRMVFAIPRGSVTYIGTTDTFYDEDINDIPIYKEEVQYLLDAANKVFDCEKLGIDDVVSSWAGLRPLIFEEGKSAGELSRKDELFVEKNGLINIVGGKLTGYRKMAEKVIDKAIDIFKENDNKRSFKRIQTHRIALSGNKFYRNENIDSYRQNLKNKLTNYQLDPELEYYLFHNYGSQCDDIFYLMDTERLNLIEAEASYCLQNELCLNLRDFFIIRTGRLYFHIETILPNLENIGHIFQRHYNWTGTKLKEQKREMTEIVRRATDFK